MYMVFLVIDIILATFLCVLVMLQPPEGASLGGLGGGTGSNFMTARSVGNTLTKMTSIVALLLFVVTLFLGVLAKRESALKPSLNALQTTQQQTTEK